MLDDEKQWMADNGFDDGRCNARLGGLQPQLDLTASSRETSSDPPALRTAVITQGRGLPHYSSVLINTNLSAYLGT